MADLLQHAVVTLVAVAAAWIVLQRVFGVFGPARAAGGPGCASCPSSRGACGPAAAKPAAAHTSAQPPGDAPLPLTLHRPTRRQG